MENYITCIYAFFACCAFAFIFEERKPNIIITSASIGAFAWFVYIFLKFLGENTISQSVRIVISTIVVAVLSEIFARVFKTPASVFLIIGIVPLVPGGKIYYTMSALLSGDVQGFMSDGLKTVAFAGSIAIGCSLVSSIVRIIKHK